MLKHLEPLLRGLARFKLIVQPRCIAWTARWKWGIKCGAWGGLFEWVFGVLSWFSIQVHLCVSQLAIWAGHCGFLEIEKKVR